MDEFFISFAYKHPKNQLLTSKSNPAIKNSPQCKKKNVATIADDTKYYLNESQWLNNAIADSSEQTIIDNQRDRGKKWKKAAAHLLNVKVVTSFVTDFDCFNKYLVLDGLNLGIYGVNKSELEFLKKRRNLIFLTENYSKFVKFS